MRRTTRSEDNPTPPEFLVCFAVVHEARFFNRGGTLPGAMTLITGMGGTNAARAVERALERKRPDWVFTCGFAGGLNPDLPSGAVVYDPKGSAPWAGRLANLGARPVSFHRGERIASSAGEKLQLRETTGADAVEMESHIIREIVVRQGVPCATVRVISDAAHEDLPLDFNRLMNHRSAISYPKLAWALVRCPNRIAALARFQRTTRKAARQLGTVLEELIRQPLAMGG